MRVQKAPFGHKKRKVSPDLPHDDASRSQGHKHYYSSNGTLLQERAPIKVLHQHPTRQEPSWFHSSGSRSTAPLEQRHQFRACLSVLRKGDQICVARLDRIGRSQVEVINRLNDLQQKGIHVRTLDGLIDTQALGKMAPLVIGLLTGLSEVEKSLIVERSRESVEHRRKTGGNLGGRPKTSNKKESLVLRLRKEGESYRSIKDQTGLALATITRIIKEQEVTA
jgi:DNA invertase Pin-like site-specific DNA recombinase